MNRGLVPMIVVAALVLIGSAQAGHTWTLSASSRAISIGGLRVYGGTVLPTYQGAITRFGTPQTCVLRPFSERQKPASNYSRVRWTTLGLSAEFITYGLIPDGGDACSKPHSVQLSTVTVTGTRWQTDRGLKVGDTVARLQQLYPTALPHGHSFWIVTRKNVVGSVSTVPVFSATVAHGRVGGFVLSIGAQGD